MSGLFGAARGKEADEGDAVAGDFGFEEVSVSAQVFLAPEVADTVRAFNAEVRPRHEDAALGLRGVE